RGPDLAFAGKDQRVLAGWRIEQNWRQVQPPPTDDPGAKQWIPAAKDWVRPVTRINLDPASPDYLRPDKDSPLTKEGAGKDDPTLPRYRQKALHRGTGKRPGTRDRGARRQRATRATTPQAGWRQSETPGLTSSASHAQGTG